MPPRLAMLLSLACALTCACGGEAGGPDAGQDAGRDAGREVGRDAGPPPPTLSVGATTVDITPEPGIVITGYGDRVSTSVRDPLEAGVLVLRDPPEALALVTLDVPGLYDVEATALRRQVASALRIPPSAVLVAASHTHSAPIPSVDPRSPDGWSEGAFLAIAEAAVAADAARRPATVGYGEAPITFDINRRVVIDGAAVTGPNPEGDHDPRARTLVFREASSSGGSSGGGSGELLALLTLVVCHPNVLLGEESTVISADFPGEARERLLARRGVPWLYLSGAEGDTRPNVVDEAGAFRLGTDADLEALGEELAGAVEAGVEEARPLRAPTLGSADLLWAAPLVAGGERPLVLAAWRIGGLALVTIPGEPFVAIGLDAEAAIEAAGYEDAMVIGYANGYASYIAPPEEHPLGGYEIGRSLLHPDASPLLIEALTSLAESLR